MTECEQILAGRSSIRNYDIDNDFDNREIKQLLDSGIISPRDIGMLKASDLIIDGILDYDIYSLTDFPPYEQIRQLENGAVSKEDFLRLTELQTFDACDWLYLLRVLPGLYESAPWEKLQAEGSVSGWMELLARCPEFAHYADWKKLAEKGAAEDFFRLLEQTPELYPYFTNKEELLAADSGRWAKLIAGRTEAAEVYSPPEEVDARRQANAIGHSTETFAGIYSTRNAEPIIADFRKAAADANLPLSIKMEEIHHD